MAQEEEGAAVEMLTMDGEPALDDVELDADYREERSQSLLDSLNSGDQSFLDTIASIDWSWDRFMEDQRRNWRKRVVYVAVVLFFFALIVSAYLMSVILGFGSDLQPATTNATMPMASESMEMAEDEMDMEMMNSDHARSLDCGDIDSDGDGVGDRCDMCKYDSQKLFPGQCGCGTRDVDSDGDGLMDCLDLCPDDPTKIKPGMLGCGGGEEPGMVSPTAAAPLSAYQQQQYAKDVMRWRWMKTFPDFVASVLTQPPTPADKEDAGSDLMMWRSCWNDENLYRMTTDPACTALWLRHLRDNAATVKTAISLSNLGSANFKSGMRLGLDDPMPMNALFRPCISEDITYERNFTYANDVNAFAIDRILGFNRAPAALEREFSSSELSGSHVSNYFSTCGTGSSLKGAMIGWFPFTTLKLDGSNKQKYTYFFGLSSHELNALYAGTYESLSRMSTAAEVSGPLETVALNMWYYLTGVDNYRHEHSLAAAVANDGFAQFLTYTGNNAAQLFTNSTHEQADVFKKICRFPEDIAKRLLILQPQRTHHALHEFREQQEGEVTVGGLLRRTLLAMGSEALLTPRQLDVLDINANNLANAIKWCIAEQGEAAVLIPEHRVYERDFNFFSTTFAFFSGSPSQAHEFEHDDDEF